MLKRVHIENFKSLKDVTLDLQPINLLIGPNNSGKTNFLKALMFFQDCVAHKLYTFEEFDKMQYRPDKNYEIIINLIRQTETNSYHHGKLVATPSFDESEIEFFKSKSIDTEDSDSSQFYSLDDKTLIKSNGITDKVMEYIPVMGLIGNTRIYHLNLSVIIESNNLNPDEYVYGDGSNLTSFILNMSQGNKNILRDIQQQLSECVGDIVGVATPAVKVGNEVKLRLRLLDKFGNDYWAEDVSEGILLFLALLCIVNQPNPPKLLLLEEPEKGIHPRRIREVMEFIRRLVAEKDIQVIMTTHSPLLLDEFADSPESVFIFDKDDEGATHVKNLQRDVIEPDLALSQQNGVEPPNYTDSLGESWKIGFLGGVPR